MAAVFASGLGSSSSLPISLSPTFIGPTVTLSVTSTTQTVFVTASRAMGSSVAGGASALNLYVCRQLGVAAPVALGAGSFGQTCLQNTRTPMGLNAVFTGLAAGSYLFGLCATVSNANWDNNEFGYTSAILMN